MKHIKIYENFLSWFTKNKKAEPKKEEIRIESKIDPSKQIDSDDCIYTDKYTQEDLSLSHYDSHTDTSTQKHRWGKEKDKIHCPLCKLDNITITHGQKLNCPNCKMKMINYGNSLTCKIDNETLKFYTNLHKFNL